MFKKLIELLQNCLITKDYFTRKNFTSFSLNDMIKSQVNTIKKIQGRRVAYWQLQHMSDSALKDIGITRGEIKSKFQDKENL